MSQANGAMVALRTTEFAPQSEELQRSLTTTSRTQPQGLNATKAMTRVVGSSPLSIERLDCGPVSSQALALNPSIIQASERVGSIIKMAWIILSGISMVGWMIALFWGVQYIAQWLFS
ncbi:hypothetical protein [Bradyrhizobium sp. ORS 86]|uniref:hypothetical protein n=1 Tax=Bradyrhizobium sp. ORS 86 TaxID=1685970 RepID=UPI00388FD690